MRRKVGEVRLDSELNRELRLSTAEFDLLVDRGYDDILVITPSHRYLVSLDDFLDYGELFDNGVFEEYVLSKSFIASA